MVTVTDTNGNALSWASAGGLGFRGSKKVHPLRSPDCGRDRCQGRHGGLGLKTVEVYVKGPGSGP